MIYDSARIDIIIAEANNKSQHMIFTIWNDTLDFSKFITLIETLLHVSSILHRVKAHSIYRSIRVAKIFNRGVLSDDEQHDANTRC